MPVESELSPDGIRTITLNRPPANAIHYDVMEELIEAFDHADDDWNTRVVILQSKNEKFFSGGWDVKAKAPDPDTLPPAVPQFGSYRGREVFRAMYQCGAPVIAKIDGIAVGAGFLYACLADFVVASENAQFGQFEIKVDAVGGCGIVRRMMSEQAMRYLTWTAKLVSARKLSELGAGIHVVPRAELDDEVAELAQLLASRSSVVTRHTKAAMNQVERLGPLEAYTFEQMHSQIISQAGADNNLAGVRGGGAKLGENSEM